jgi:hypothetical protein
MSLTTSKEHIIVIAFQGDHSISSSEPLLGLQQGHPIVEGINSFAIWAKEGLWKLKILHHAKT